MKALEPKTNPQAPQLLGFQKQRRKSQVRRVTPGVPPSVVRGPAVSGLPSGVRPPPAVVSPSGSDFSISASQHVSLFPAPLLTRRDLAAVLKLSVRTIDRLTAAGAIPCRRLGKSVRYHLPDVLAAL